VKWKTSIPELRTFDQRTERTSATALVPTYIRTGIVEEKLVEERNLIITKEINAKKVSCFPI
jgi:hypothetical protein